MEIESVRLSTADWWTIQNVRGKLAILADYLEDWDSINHADPVAIGLIGGILECANQLIGIKSLKDLTSMTPEERQKRIAELLGTIGEAIA